MTTPAEHAATVGELHAARDRLLNRRRLGSFYLNDVRLIVALAERATELEDERYSGDDMAEAFQRGRLAERNERDSARQAALAHMERLLGDERRRAEQLERAVEWRELIAEDWKRRAELADMALLAMWRLKQQLETALRALYDVHYPNLDEHERNLARAALDGGTATPEQGGDE